MANDDVAVESPRKKAIYDPDQDPEEKRVLRQKYRVLLKDEQGNEIHSRPRPCVPCPAFSFLLGNQLNVNEYTTQELLEKVQLADSLFDQGKKRKCSPRPYVYHLYAPTRYTSMTQKLLFALALAFPSIGPAGSDARLCLPRDCVQHARSQSPRDESRRWRVRH